MGVELVENEALVGRLIARLRSNNMWAQSALVFGGSMVLNICSFFFHAIASRKLGVADYGVLYALLSACAIAVAPATVLTSVVARFAAEFKALHDDSHVRGLVFGIVRGFGVIGLGYLAGAVVFQQPLAEFLHAPPASILLAVIIVVIVLNSSMLRAVAQGTQRFLVFSGSTVIEGATKVFAAFVLLMAGFGLFGSIIAFAIGSFCGLACVAGYLFYRYTSVPPQNVHYDWSRIAIAVAGSASLAITVALMGNADVVLVKHFLPSSEAGLYAATSLVGKIMLFVAGFIPIVLLPQASDRHARGVRTRGVLLTSCGMLAGIALCGLCVVKFFGIFLLHALVGHAFDAAQGLLVWYAAAMVFLAFTNALGSYGIATHRLAFAIPVLLFTIVTLGMIALYHPSLIRVVQTLFVGNLVTTTVVALILGIQGLRLQRR